jgi:hypothetical protein
MDVVSALVEYFRRHKRFTHDRVRSTAPLYRPSFSLDSMPR